MLEEIRSLKQRIDGDIYVSGSGTLVRALLTDGLVDALHLFVYPVALGEDHDCSATALQAKFTLSESEAYDNGVVHLAYGRAAELQAAAGVGAVVRGGRRAAGGAAAGVRRPAGERVGRDGGDTPRRPAGGRVGRDGG